MMKVNLRSGKTLDAETVEVNQHTLVLKDRNGDIMNRVGQPIVESFEAV
jgi:hypothetical protein